MDLVPRAPAALERPRVPPAGALLPRQCRRPRARQGGQRRAGAEGDRGDPLVVDGRDRGVERGIFARPAGRAAGAAPRRPPARRAAGDRALTLRAVTFDFWGTLFQWNTGAAEIRRSGVREFVARHRAELSPEVVDAAFAAGVAAQTEAWRGQSLSIGPAGIVEHFLAELRLEVRPESRAELQALIEDPEPDRRLTPVAGVEE